MIKKILDNIRTLIIKIYLLLFTSNRTKKINIGKYTILINGLHALPRYMKQNPYYSTNLPRLATHLKETHPDLKMIDVGANIGDTVALVKNQVEIPILCIEGDSNYYNLLKENIKQFKDVESFQIFLGEKDNLINGSLISAEGTLRIEKNDPSSNIKIITLDNFLKQHQNFTHAKLIKIDTDGYDIKIIRGGWNYITKNKPILFFEWDRFFLQKAGDDGISILEELKKIGYSRIIFYDNLGRFIISTTLKDMGIIKQLYLYTYKKKGAFPYYDIAIFPDTDETSALSFIQKEIELQNKDTL